MFPLRCRGEEIPGEDLGEKGREPGTLLREQAAEPEPMVSEKMGVEEISHVMGNLMGVLKDSNATADALRCRFKVLQDFPGSCDPLLLRPEIQRRLFSGKGTYLMGAAQIFIPRDRTCSWRSGAGSMPGRDTGFCCWLTVSR